MRKILILLLYIVPILMTAQTQQGYVKTRGRMVNGQLVKGVGLPGAVVSVQNGNNVMAQGSNGAFSMVVPSKSFRIQSVQKKGYQLVDADATTKTYQYSVNPLYLVMETPEQQQSDLVAAQQKIRRTLQRQLQQREEEIEALQASQREKDSLLRVLYEQQSNNEKLIADMAKEYAQMDYDQMDELNRRISDAILEGRLLEADSLLRSKGDINSRIAKNKRKQEAEAREAEELARRQQNLEQSQAGTQKEKEDIAADCYKFYDRFKLANQYDSAAYYIQLRAELDTTNHVWQFDAAYYFTEQKQYQTAIMFYERTLEILRSHVAFNLLAYEPAVALTLNNLANLYDRTQRFTESERMFKEALEIYRRRAASNPQAYESNVAMTLNNLAILYYNTQRFTESESMYKETLEIYRRLASSNPQTYEPDVAQTLNNLAALYSDTQRLTDSERMYKEALGIRRRLAQSNPETYEPDVAATQYNLGILYSNTKRFAESEQMYKEALEVRRRLAASNPQAYEPDLAKTLNNLATLYADTQRLTEAEQIYKEALEIYQRLAKTNPQIYERYLASTWACLGFIHMRKRDNGKALEYFEKALPVLERSFGEKHSITQGVKGIVDKLKQ